MSKTVDLGAIWKKKSKNGKEYLSGTINIFPFGQIKVVGFVNEYKQNDNHPDFKLYYEPNVPEAPGGLEKSDKFGDAPF